MGKRRNPYSAAGTSAAAIEAIRSPDCGVLTRQVKYMDSGMIEWPRHFQGATGSAGRTASA